MTNNEKLSDLIADPIEGPYEGEDFWVDENNTIQVTGNNIMLAGKIMRKVNSSGLFERRLVKIGQRGDNLLLGFDTLVDVEPSYSTKIGFKRDTLAEVKKDEQGKYCVYLNGQRTARLFKKLVSAKQFLKQIDHELKQTAQESELIED